MRTAVVTRFMNQIQYSTFVRSATMEATSAMTHRSPKVKMAENKSNFDEFVAGESIVGEKNVVGKVRPRRFGR